MEEFDGDRECPNCSKISLLETGLSKWQCQICKEIFDEEYLDGSEE